MARNTGLGTDRFRRLSIGLVGGGLLFSVLSMVGTVYAVSGTLLGLGALAWYEEYTRNAITIVGTGLGIVLVGTLGLLETTLSTGVEPLEFTTIVVWAGAFVHVLAPVYLKRRDADEETRNGTVD